MQVLGLRGGLEVVARMSSRTSRGSSSGVEPLVSGSGATTGYPMGGFAAVASSQQTGVCAPAAIAEQVGCRCWCVRVRVITL
jgi:hypothetical protein